MKGSDSLKGLKGRPGVTSVRTQNPGREPRGYFLCPKTSSSNTQSSWKPETKRQTQNPTGSKDGPGLMVSAVPAPAAAHPAALHPQNSLQLGWGPAHCSPHGEKDDNDQKKGQQRSLTSRRKFRREFKTDISGAARTRAAWSSSSTITTRTWQRLGQGNEGTLPAVPC